jgi:hypothetical protein
VADGELQTAWERVRRLHNAGRLRQGVLGQLADVDRELAELERRYAAEQRDVARLEGRGLAAIVASVLGNRDEKLATERAEADAARLRLEGHRARRRHLAAECAVLDRELADLAGAPQRYEVALAAADRALQATGDPRGAQLSQLAVELANVCADQREHAEAYRAGRVALEGLNAVLGHLGSARAWSTADMLSGSLADWVEHDRLEKAHTAAWHAQQALDRFAREMADIGAQVNPRVPEIDTRWFVDWFFDNIIVDAIRHRRIACTQEQVADLAQWLHDTLNRLRRNQVALERREAELRARREALHGLV